MKGLEVAAWTAIGGKLSKPSLKTFSAETKKSSLQSFEVVCTHTKLRDVQVSPPKLYKL